jgi:hypothetical protein
MIEYMMDILWMALAAMPFAVGMAQPPKPIGAGTINKSTKAVSGANQADVASGVLAGVNLLTDTGETLNAAELKTLRDQAATADARITRLTGLINKGGKPSKIAQWQAELERLTTAKTERDTKIATLASPDFAANKLRGALPEQFGMRDNVVSSLGASLSPTSEYTRMQDALGRGLDARTSGDTRLGSVADVEAGRADRVADISAGQVGAGQLGGSLMSEALRRMMLQGRLSDQDSRDVTQATRQGFAARGMATGNAALGAELLNRDRFTRQRAFQDMAFASGVQDQDLQRQNLNFNRSLEAAAANQRTGLGLSVADLNAVMQARTANQDTASRMSIAQGNLTQGDNQFNAKQLASNDLLNIGFLGQSAAAADQERMRQIGAAEDQYNFAMATDPTAAALKLGAPYQNLTGATAAGLNVASFNKSMEGNQYNTLMNNNASMYAANAAKPTTLETIVGIGRSIFGK